MINLIPICFFFISILFRMMDTSVKIYRNIHFEDNFIFGVPIKLMKEDLKSESISDNLKNKIKRNIYYRKCHYLFLIFCFFCIPLLVIFKRLQ